MKQQPEVFVLVFSHSECLSVNVTCFQNMEDGFSRMITMFNSTVRDDLDGKLDDPYILEVNEPLIGGYIPEAAAAASILTEDDSYEWRLYRKEVV